VDHQFEFFLISMAGYMNFVSQNISFNPELWEFEHSRIEEYLSRRPISGEAETGRIFNLKNDIIVRSGNELAPPIITKSSVLRDSGVEVGRIEISRSLRPLMEQTGLIAGGIALLVLSVYLLLRALLFRTLNRARNLVEQKEAHYRAVVEDIPMMLCRFFSDGRLSFANNAYCRYFDKTTEEVLGDSFKLPVLEEDRRFDPSRLSFLTSDNPTETYEFRVIAGNGETRWQRWIIHAIFQEGRQVEFQSISEDITERKQAEEERERVVRELRSALNEVKTLRGFIPTWASCKKVRDDKGDWDTITTTLTERTAAIFCHSICQACAKRLNPSPFEE
ncbi:MAG: PAS domain S-box protein, partial [Deltaproteobacteria bacterium]|nr:PAS domain S-box protein [Deltaproteobacteria bacterium]